MKPRVQCTDRQAWRTWLTDNHDTCAEVWLVFFKKQTGKQSIAYRDAVEEAICFGWIDGLKRSIDEERYAYRFTPRRKNSKWSPLNIELAERLTKEGLMTPAGVEAFKRRQRYDKTFLRARRSEHLALTPQIEEALRSNALAWKNYNALAPGYRKQYAAWLTHAVKPETRARRLKEAIELLEQNRKLGMK